MAKILAVHGIGQQFKGDAILHKEWWPALLSGLHLAGADISDDRELVCAFYGHLFRKSELLGTSETYQPKDVTAEEAALLHLLWETASQVEAASVPAPAEFNEGNFLGRWPTFVQQALNALSRSKFFSNISQSLMIGDLKQVVRYMNDSQIHDDVQRIVQNLLTEDTRVVIGHSLGSVVAYEALCRKPANVVSFITLGSPLGIRNLIFDRLTPPPHAGIGVWPGRVTQWTNIADKGDIVAMQRQLAPLFGDRIKDILVHNGADAHHGEWYLTTVEVGGAIRGGLWANEF
jgi:hypothetical protein